MNKETTTKEHIYEYIKCILQKKKMFEFVQCTCPIGRVSKNVS